MNMMSELGAIAPPRVTMTGVTKRFGALTALDAVSIDIAPGSFHARC